MKKHIHSILQIGQWKQLAIICGLLAILSDAQAQVNPWSISNNKVYISSSHIKIGIGTSSPNERLHVKDGNILVHYQDGPQARWGQSSNGGMYFGTTTSHYLRLGAANNESIIIKQNGNVGIGVAPTDDYRLTLKGGISVSNNTGSKVFNVTANGEMVLIGSEAYVQYQTSLNDPTAPIQSNNYSLWVSKGIMSEDFALAPADDWADYVFDKDYALPSLQQLEAFILENKHLPSIPSEATVKKSGYSTHQLNLGFLKTIEELTLYAIDQDKKLRELEAQLASQEALLKQLADELAAIKAKL